MAKLIKFVKWGAAIIGWFLALAQWFSSHPIPPGPGP